MTNFRPEFIPETSPTQRILTVISAGDLVREEGTGTWYIGDGSTLGGVAAGATLTYILNAVTTYTISDNFAPSDSGTETPTLAAQVVQNTTAMRDLVLQLYKMFGDDFLQESETLLKYLPAEPI